MGGVDGGEGGDKEVSNISRGLCSVWNYVSTLTRDLLVGPPTDLDNCVNAFFDTSDLKGVYWACPSSGGCVPALVGVSQLWWACPSTDLHFVFLFQEITDIIALIAEGEFVVLTWCWHGYARPSHDAIT